MLKELLEKTKLVSVFHEDVLGDYTVALAQPRKDDEWLSFVHLVLLRQQKNETFFIRVYAIQNQKLVTAWGIYSKNPESLKKFVTEAVEKPQWLKNYKIDGKNMRGSLIGDPIDPPDPSIILGLTGQR
jgi:hypothetical protein